VAMEWSIVDMVGLERSTSSPASPRAPATSRAPTVRSTSSASASASGRLNDSAGFLGHVGDHPDWHEGNLHGDLWLAAHAGYARTGNLDRFGFDAALGYDCRLVDGFSAGPYARYLHVVQPDDEPLDTHDASALSFGSQARSV